MTATQILAKSRANGTAVTLADHTRAVLRAVCVMFGEPPRPTRLAREWLRFFRLDADDFGAFFHNLWVAGAAHDIGKANDGFQRAVRHCGEQAIRHEHLSALLLWQEPVQAWLRAHREERIDAEIVIAAVVSHHLKVSDKEFATCLVDSERAAVRVYVAAPDVAAVLSMAAEKLAASPVDLSATGEVWDFEAIGAARERFQAHMHRFNRALRGDERRKRLLLAVKAALIAVDSAGSAIRRMGQDLEEWLGAAFDRPPLTEVAIEEGVITPRVRELASKGRWHGFHDFQSAAGALGPRALLLSGCGTGKTLAAWMWIAAQLRSRAAARVIFLYPTRATATEGFRDYVSWTGPEMAALVSGTSQYDLEGMFSNPADLRFGRDYTAPERLFALAYWHRAVFSATVDSFLAFMSNRYAALCTVPLLADSVIVFDEVHSFDDSMFRALDRFLTFFDAPVLCMTASLPRDRIRVLHHECGLEVFPREPGQFENLHRQAVAPRYRVRWIEGDAGHEIAIAALRAGKKVLWVINTVPRCQEVAQRLMAELAGAFATLCYHSRLRLADRRRRHEDTIALFRRDGPGVLLSTQVCEMSLDLDADVLITEVAEVPALIQRMGRCCREPIPSEGRIGEVYVYQPAAPRPYTTREIEAGVAFARELAIRESVTQADLAEYLARSEVMDPSFAVGGFTGFLDSGWYAMARDDSFREDDEYTVDCVLDADLVAYLRARAGGSGQAAGFIVPVPRRFTEAHPQLGAYVRVAPSAHYDERFGFLTTEARRG